MNGVKNLLETKPFPIFHFNYFNSLRFLGMAEVILKDLAFKFRSSREVEDRGVCLSPFRASYGPAEKRGI
jgi:hypothetical protein